MMAPYCTAIVTSKNGVTSIVDTLYSITAGRTQKTYVTLTADSGAARAEIVPQNSPLGTISVLSELPRLFSKPHILCNDVLE